MLNAFVRWARHIQVDCDGKRVQAQISAREHAGDPSVRLSLETPLALARISFWQSRNYIAEIVARDTSMTLYLEHGRLDAGVDVALSFAPFIEALGVGLKSPPTH